MTDAEVMTKAIVAAVFYRGNFEAARTHLQESKCIPAMLSKSRFNRRSQRLREVFLTLFAQLGECWKDLNADSIYSIDRYPIAVRDNYRIRYNKRYPDKAYRGYIASKRRFFYGFKGDILLTATGEPIEFFLTPGSYSDIGCIEDFNWDLPPDSTVYADRGYNKAAFEETDQVDGQITFQPMRRENMKQQFPAG